MKILKMYKFSIHYIMHKLCTQETRLRDFLTKLFLNTFI